jgi:hypothetical protein
VYDLSALIEKMDTLELAELDITSEQMFSLDPFVCFISIADAAVVE